MFAQKNFTFTFSTKHTYELINITREVEKFVHDAQIKNGICMISHPHTTACLVVNEDEEGLKNDMLERILELAPEKDYAHNRIDSNARAHLINAILGNTKLFSIEGSHLKRGRWQEVFFVELDGPRKQRRVEIEILGEAL